MAARLAPGVIRPMTETVTEAQFQTAVIELARTFGWLVMHSRPSLNKSGKWSTAIQGDKGYPDLTLAKPKRPTLHVELKAEKGRLTPEQKVWAEALDGYHLWRPSDWQVIVRTLSEGRARVGLDTL